MLLQQVFLFVLGLVFGSFISALSYRYPKGISVAKGRSFCPKCKHQIRWHDNIPLLSFLLLGGKCRNCKGSISWRYPGIELATALGFMLIGMTFQGTTLQGAYSIFIFLILELIFIIDLEHQIIPDSFVFFGISLVFLFLLVTNHQSPITNLFSGFLAASLLMFIHLFTRGRGMGLGDVKFAALGGMVVGLNLSLIWLFLAFLTGGFIGIILILDKKAGLKDKIAFGPFLVVSIPITLIWGEKIIGILLLH